MAGTTTYYGISYPTNTDYVKDGATAMQTIADGFDSAVAIPTYNNQTGTTYTFVLADAGKTVTSNNASAVTFTIPPQASVAWANNTTLTVRNLGAGVVTIAGGSGVTVTNTAQTVAQYGEVKLIRTASNAWTVVPASGGASGLTLIKSQSFTSVASVDVTSCFNSQYTNYKVLLYTNQASTANRDITLQLLSGTTPATTSYYQGMSLVGSTGGNSYQNVNNGGSIIVCQIWDTLGDMGAADITVFKPFATMRSNFTITNSQVSAGNYSGAAGGAIHATSASYDGFRLSVSGTTFGGIVKIYGIQD